MAISIERFIAQRTSREGANSTSQGESGLMVRVSTIAISLSVAVMILTLAVIFGFKSGVYSHLTALSGDIIVTTPKGLNSTSRFSIEQSDQIERVVVEASIAQGSEVSRISPYALRGAILRSSRAVEGVILKGVDQSNPLTTIERGLVEGDMPSIGGEKISRNVVISQILASQMDLKIGERLELLVANDNGAMRRDLYRVGAIYEAGTGEAERALILTDIRNVQRLNGWHNGQISGYEVSLVDRYRSEAVEAQINRDLLLSPQGDIGSIAALSTRQLFPSIFDWLSALDINAVVVITIMMIVAIFNIITVLLILVLERVQMIGILKTLGMNNRSIREIFLHRALSITLRGLAWGNGIGLAIALLQREFQIIKLDASGYILDVIPIELSLWWIALLNIGVVVTILLVVVVPTRLVSSIEPCTAVKFE